MTYADFETLLQHADLAMYQAKAGGRDALAFYQPGLSEQLRERTLLEQALREGHLIPVCFVSARTGAGGSVSCRYRATCTALRLR